MFWQARARRQSGARTEQDRCYAAAQRLREAESSLREERGLGFGGISQIRRHSASERRCAPQRGGVLSALRVPVNVREALAGGTRRAGREFVSLSGGGNAAVVTGAVRRPSPRPRCRGGGHSTGKAGRSNHAAELSRPAAHGTRRCEQQAGCLGAPGKASAENVRRSSFVRKYPWPGVTVGVRTDQTGSRNATRRAKEG